MAVEVGLGTRKMKLSVTIVTRERKDDLRAVLLDLRRQTRPADEILVLDNASTDSTSEMVKAGFPEARVLRAEENLGCPGGRNVAYREVSGEIIVAVDDDLALPPDALAMFEERMAEDPRVGLVFARIVDHRDGSDARWHYGGPLPKSGDGPRYTWTFVAGATAARTEALAQAGLYPDDYVRQCEEFDLSYRLLQHGWRILYDPGIVCPHKASPLARFPPQIAFLQTRNDLWTCWRNLPWQSAIAYTLWKSVRYPFAFSRRGLLLASLRGAAAAVWSLPRVLPTRSPISHSTWRLVRHLKQHAVFSAEEMAQLEASVRSSR